MTDNLNWIVAVILGAMLGVLGQGVRTILAYKKARELKDDASNKDVAVPADAEFSLQRLGLPLLVGGISGALCAILLDLNGKAADKETILSLIAAGYSGADFLEGILRKAKLPV